MVNGKIELSVVIPVFNSSACLPELVQQLTGTLEQLQLDYEIIMVDDASRDRSWKVIEELSDSYPRLMGLHLMRNAGQTAALLCGLRRARGALVVTMDDDLQHSPEELPRLLTALAHDVECDCVFGYFPEKQHLLYRNLASRLVMRVCRSEFSLPPDLRMSSWRVMRRRLVDILVAQKGTVPVINTLIFGVSNCIKSVAVKHAPRYEGSSNYTLVRQVRLAFDLLVNITMLPLRLVSLFGLLVSGASLFLAFVYIVQYLAGKTQVAGWTTVVVLITFFSGAILFSLGVLGEYLFRILREVRGFPSYVVREECLGKDIDPVIADPKAGDFETCQKS